MANETEMTRDERSTYLKGMHPRYHQTHRVRRIAWGASRGAHRVGRIAWGEARSWTSSDGMEQVTGLHRPSLVGRLPGPRLVHA